MFYARLSDLQGYKCREMFQGSNGTDSFMFCIASRGEKSANIWEAARIIGQKIDRTGRRRKLRGVRANQRPERKIKGWRMRM